MREGSIHEGDLVRLGGIVTVQTYSMPELSVSAAMAGASALHGEPEVTSGLRNQPQQAAPFDFKINHTNPKPRRKPVLRGNNRHSRT
jgi:hypothetical protein